MIELVVKRQEWKPNDRKHQAPVMEGINESVTLRDADTGEVVLVQYVMDEALLEDRRWLARQLRFNTEWNDKQSTKNSVGTARLNGMRYESRTFGSSAPAPLRRRYGCSYATFNSEHPDTYRVLEKMTVEWWRLLNDYMPLQAAQHEALVSEAIHPDWWIGGTPWTSGIINNTAALPYHRDSNNIKGTMSAMLCLRNRVGGGGLHVPEYDVTLGIPDASVTIFDGQELFHGVTPLVNERPDGYRYTMVWYSKSGIKACGCAEDEPLRAAKRSTELSEQ